MLVVAGLISLHNFLKQKVLFATWVFFWSERVKKYLIFDKQDTFERKCNYKNVKYVIHFTQYGIKKVLAHIILIIKITLLYGCLVLYHFELL